MPGIFTMDTAEEHLTLELSRERAGEAQTLFLTVEGNGIGSVTMTPEQAWNLVTALTIRVFQTGYKFGDE